MNLASENPEQLAPTMQGMIQELESTEVVYPVQAGHPLVPVIPRQ